MKHCHVHVCCSSCLQGLPERVRDRVTQWHFACPCDLSMYVSDAENMSSDDIQTGIETAVRQIAPCLPRGSRVYALPHHDVLYRQDARANAAGAAAVATVAPAVPHVKLMPGPMPGTDEGMGMLLQETPPAQEVRIDRLDLTGAHAEVSRSQTCTHVHIRMLTHTHTHTHMRALA